MTPDKYTLKEFFLDVGDGHRLYVQDWGNIADKTPVIFLHGGPGSNVKDGHKLIFSPHSQRVIFFDQRGCGQSTPYGSLKANTTADLIEDIEKLAIKLKLQQFVICGGSWGSCLALVYGLKYPARVKAMVLRGIFTGTQNEIDWLKNGAFKRFFPDVWDNLLKITPKKYWPDPSAYHFQRVLGSNKADAKKSAYAIANTEAALLTLDDRFSPPDYKEFDPTSTTLEIYYMANRCFLTDRYILENANKLNIPIWLIQGRYDMVCPPETAYELDQQLPNSHLIWTVAGHGNDRANYDVSKTIFMQLAGK